MDDLFEQFGLLDSEGYLLGTGHPKVKNMYKRIEYLNSKEIITEDEEDEAALLFKVSRAYVDELNKYIESTGLTADYTDDSDFESQTLSYESDEYISSEIVSNSDE